MLPFANPTNIEAVHGQMRTVDMFAGAAMTTVVSNSALSQTAGDDGDDERATRTVPSRDTLAMSTRPSPTRQESTCHTSAAWQTSARSTVIVGVRIDHWRTPPSSPPEQNASPDGNNEQDHTRPSCPNSDAAQTNAALELARRHTRNERSSDAVRIVHASALHCTHRTDPS